MERIKSFAILPLIFATTLLIGAGEKDDSGNIDPHSHENVPNAVVKTASGADNIQFGEFINEPSVDRWLMVINADCDQEEKTIYLGLLPGPGRYRFDIFRSMKDGDDYILDSVGTPAYVSPGVCNFNFDLEWGQAALIHIVTLTEYSEQYTLPSESDSATYAVNGRKIAVDRWGRIHVCYNDVDNGVYEVWYGRSDDAAGTWKRQEITDHAICPTIAVDTFGIPWISYLEHPSRNKLYLWSEGFDTAAVVIDLDDPNDEITNAPAIALDFEQGLGVAYYSSQYKARSGLILFELPSVKVLDTDIYRRPTTYTVAPVSCCITKEGYGLATGIEYHSNESRLFSRRDNLLGSTGISFTEGEHGDPNVAKQGKLVWAAYYQPSSHTIRYKKTNSYKDYEFEDDDNDPGSVIATLASSYRANSVQLAEGKAFVVWSRVNNSGSEEIVYYSYLKNGAWTTPTPADAPPTGTLQRYPHVAFDNYRDTVWIIWTEIAPSGTAVKVEGLSLEQLGLDSVLVVRPEGGEQWLCGFQQKVSWEHSSSLTPTQGKVEWSYNGGNSWINIYQFTGHPDDYFMWPVGIDKDGNHHNVTSDNCLIKVALRYDNKEPYDISRVFSVHGWGFVVPEWLKPVPNGNEEQIMCYEPPREENEIPWELVGLTGVDTVILQVSTDQGASYSPVGGGLPSDTVVTDTFISTSSDTTYFCSYTGSITWTTPTQPTSHGYLRLMGVDTLGDTAYSVPFFPFAVAPAGGFAYSTYSNQNIMSLNDDGDKIGLVYTTRDPDTAAKFSVLYMESEDGIDFSTPDTVAEGCWPSFSEGACFWQDTMDRTLYYAYQLNDTFSTPYPFLTIPIADSANIAAVGCLSENDTVHIVSRTSTARYYPPPVDDVVYKLSFVYSHFLETSPNNPTTYTLVDSTSLSSALYDTTKTAASLVKLDSALYFAYRVGSSCYFSTLLFVGMTPVHIKRLIGYGYSPQLSLSEGNLTYTYIGMGDTSLIRLWRYVDDTTWIERDTFKLDNGINVLCADRGLMYGVQREDTSIADLYVYDPISEDYYLTRTYQGHYQHPWIDDGSSEFSWINTYCDYIDSTTSYLHTERNDMNVILPALYLESDDKRSPYTVYRDTCIHYASVGVDSAQDSLKYSFPHLDDSKDYAVILEFYTECDSATQLQITLGSTVDTVQIAGNSYSWYEQDIESRSETMNLKIRRISAAGFVPVSRVIVRERSEEGLFMMCGVQGKDPGIIPFCLYQPFPNPFSDAATIRYSLPHAAHVSLKVYDISGRLVTKLVDDEVPPGVHTMRWEGRDYINRRCSSGVYFVRMETKEYRASKKMVLLK